MASEPYFVGTQEALSEEGKHVHKDTHWDLARIKRWRWRDKFGMGALTGSDRFIARKYPQVDEERFKPPPGGGTPGLTVGNG